MIDLLILFTPSDEQLKRIQAIDSRLRVVANELGFRADIRRSAGETLSPEETLAQRAFEEQLAQAEVIFTSYAVPPGPPQRAPKLKWLHTGSAGVERIARSPLMESDVLITNSRGNYAAPVSEYVVFLMLMLAKHGPRLVHNQQRQLWDPLETPVELAGRTVGIVGLGSIGRATAKLCKAFDMRVVGTQRSVLTRTAQSPLVDLLYPRHELRQMLAECDYVVIAVPLTAETKRLIGAAELKAMKPTSYLINVARGAVVDEEALVEALQRGEIAGAGLDVFVEEPLPPESPLWELPNCIIAPHRSGVSDRREERNLDLFCQNLQHYVKGEPLLNIVDKHKGY